MIQLKASKTGEYELTDKKVIVTLADHQVKIGEEVFSETGEYEVSGVEVIFGATAALVVWEQLHLLYLFGETTPSVFEKTQFASCDVMLIDKHIATLKKDLFEETLDAYDPRVLVIANSTTIEATSKESLQIQDSSLIKLAEQVLPTEGRDFYRLV